MECPSKRFAILGLVLPLRSFAPGDVPLHRLPPPNPRPTAALRPDLHVQIPLALPEPRECGLSARMSNEAFGSRRAVAGSFLVYGDGTMPIWDESKRGGRGQVGVGPQVAFVSVSL